MIRTALSPAKINWMLRVLERRPDGYHELETIFQTISLHDTLLFSEAPSLSLQCSDPSVPLDRANLVWRAAEEMMHRYGAPPLSIEIEKRIPSGGGLAGGSSNAATTLRVMAGLCDAPPSDDALHEIALALGSDVPFFLVGGTAYATGRGEKLTPLPQVSDIPLLLLLPEEKMMTPEAFRLLAALRRQHPADRRPAGLEACQEACRDGLLNHAGLLENDLEEVVFDALPRLAILRERLLSTGASWARMSGSGSTIIGAFESAAKRDDAAAAFPDIRTAAAEPA